MSLLLSVSFALFNNWSNVIKPAAFKTSLLNQGYQPYDKKLCFTSTRLAKKEDMLQDIYNYILHFDENGSAIYKSVESQKIALFIKKYKYRFEGGL